MTLKDAMIAQVDADAKASVSLKAYNDAIANTTAVTAAAQKAEADAHAAWEADDAAAKAATKVVSDNLPPGHVYAAPDGTDTYQVVAGGLVVEPLEDPSTVVIPDPTPAPVPTPDPAPVPVVVTP